MNVLLDMRFKQHLPFQELTQREAEYVSLSRDTTETDLKQRREIQGGTAFHLDQVWLAIYHGVFIITLATHTTLLLLYNSASDCSIY